MKVSTSLKLFNVTELARSANIVVRQRCILIPLVKSERDKSQSRGVALWYGMVGVALVYPKYKRY